MQGSPFRVTLSKQVVHGWRPEGGPGAAFIFGTAVRAMRRVRKLYACSDPELSLVGH
jgi:hypothetical protein